MIDEHLFSTIPSQIYANKKRFQDETFLTLLYPNRPPESFTYSLFIQHALKWSGFYQRKGLSPSDRVLISLPHSLSLYASFLGATLCGLVPAMFAHPSEKFSQTAYFDQLQALSKSSQAKLFITYKEQYDSLHQKQIHLPLPLSTDEELCESDSSVLDPFIIDDPDTMAFLQYSSGTTGLKKGVMISHQSLLWQVRNYAETIHLSRSDSIASWLPLYHDMGLIACYWLPLLTGTPVVALSPFYWVKAPLSLFEAIRNYRSTIAWLPNFAFKHLEKAAHGKDLSSLDLSSLRGLVNCSEPILSETLHSFEKRFSACGLKKQSLWTCYAMAENTFAVTSSSPPQPLFRDVIDAKSFSELSKALPSKDPVSSKRVFVSSGKALPETELSIRNEQGLPLPDRHVGEIYLKSPCLIDGYYHDSKNSKESFHGLWYKSGDLGYLVGEELFVTGRKKDLLIIGGKNIYPQDIEALIDSLKGVYPGRAVAFGIHNPEKGTEDLVAMAESSLSDHSERQQLIQKAYQKVASETDVQLCDFRLLPHMTLHKSSSGKIARSANRDSYLSMVEEPSNNDPITLQSPENKSGLLQRIRNVLGRVLSSGMSLDCNHLDFKERLISSGLVDSLSFVSLLVNLESEFSITFPSDFQVNMERFDSLENIQETLEEILERKQQASIPHSWWEEGYTDLRDTKCLNFIHGPKNFDMLILGSSRINALSASPEATDPYKAYNFGVNSAQMEDCACIYQFFTERNQVPLKKLFLGLDVDAFNNQFSPTSFLLRSPFLKSYLDANDTSPIGRFYKGDPLLKQTLSTIESNKHDRFHNLLLRLRTENDEDKELFEEGCFSFDPIHGCMKRAGSSPEDQQFNQRKAFRLEKPKIARGKEKIKMRKYTALLEKRLDYLVTVVDSCLKKGTEVVCFITTIHPDLEQFLAQETPYLDRLEDIKTFFAKTYGGDIRFYDCSTPDKFGGCNFDFTDPGHMGPHNADQLLRFLMSSFRQNLD